MKNLGTDKIIFLIIGLLTLLAVVFIAVISVKESQRAQAEGKITTYSNTVDHPKLSLSSTFSDLGKMKVKDEKTADFTITNNGSKQLQIFKIQSSCDCTFAQITIDGTKSPEFSMHSQNPWIGTIDPGKKATLSVIYRPFIMPVSGSITRDVYIQTNDPDQPKITFSVKAFVE